MNAVGPPVPIPNTEVKRCSGDNTWLETAREDSTMLTQKNRPGEAEATSGSRLFERSGSTRSHSEHGS